MEIFSGSYVGSVDIADKFESLSYKWQIVSSCICVVIFVVNIFGSTL